MKADLLFELGTEELPPRALKNLSLALGEGVRIGLLNHNLSFGEVQLFAAPRRLAVLISDLDTRTPDAETVSWGPPLKVAFDADNRPTKAAQAFANKNSLNLADLASYIENDGKQDKLCVRSVLEGRPTSELLGRVLSESLRTLPIPKRMRWGKSKEEFVRPVQWAVLLFDGVTLHEDIFGLTSGDISQGHRFLGKGDIQIRSPKSYEQQLHDGFVIVDLNKRVDIIQSSVNQLAAQIQGVAVIDPDLLIEVAALNEWPVALLGHFDKAFLAVPPEALVSSMKEHQKYFHVVDSKQQLMAAFITVANIISKNPQEIISGNERVIRPRLADAAFFYKNDSAISLIDRREALRTVVFQEKLGSLFDKTERVAALAEVLAPSVKADPALARRSGEISKSDLVSDMVGEFADLQGIMGRYYAINDGEHPDVAQAQLEQYLPRFAKDNLPATAVGTAVALADKLDTLVGIFSIGQQPSGSRDPFALRRASLAILRILVGGNIDLDLKTAIEAAARNFKLTPENHGKTCKRVLTYVLERFKAWYKDEGLKSEIFLSVASLNLSNPLDIDSRVKAVYAFSLLPEANDLAAANKRVSNILAKHANSGSIGEVNSLLFQDPAEQILANAVAILKTESKPLLEKRDYSQLLTNLASLRDPIDSFFNDVMVMVDDNEVRSNRLRLLQDLRILFINVADIAQMAVTK